MQPCNKWRRAPGQPTIGDICTDKFFEGFRKVCEEACNAKAKFDDGLGVEEYRRPSIAKCTGLGTQTKIQSCNDGYFGGVDQTLKALGMAKEEEKRSEPIVIGKKKAKVREEGKEGGEEKRKEEEGKTSEGTSENTSETSEEPKEVTPPTPEQLNSALLKSEETKKNLKPMAEAQKVHQSNVETYLEFTHTDGNVHTIELHKNEPLIDAVTHFCRDTMGEGEGAGGCAREVMMYFRIHFPEKIRGHE
ncbi:hypothetical protein TrVE_jg13239 [Triparma verrucosa]|uniref:Uncharacterized protein n=1 Tax=Triparma verrucosa TaxID=1606542 RepID=A0A9W7BI69_9STRA|nr:hypothetical protein TrVE_jg13239 [Triparma verrucosa]